MKHRLEFKAMGCRMTAIVETSAQTPPALLAEVPAWFETWEQTLSRFRANSELSQLNAAAGWPVQVSQTLWEVFQAASEAEALSSGLVTPVILEALVSAGYDRSFDLLPRQQPPKPLSAWYGAGSLAEVICDESTRTICLPLDMQLDFGGIAKGWAAHQAAKRLAACGPALVSAGGDLAIIAEQSDGGYWPIGVDDPFRPTEKLGLLMVGQGGVATSGTDYRRWRQGGQLSHHIIDPRSGAPAQTDVVSATVIAPEALLAEMAAKTALILGSQTGLDWIEARPGMAALLVLADGQVLLSEKMRRSFWRVI